ncbi:hypothetical protein EASAB2608_05895 [Streptomyces sp. EAS-AB2608]|nr:hypothetical protein EASAB2608_05895 [Streptomyces sp. EAS-AB2608]
MNAAGHVPFRKPGRADLLRVRDHRVSCGQGCRELADVSPQAGGEGLDVLGSLGEWRVIIEHQSDGLDRCCDVISLGIRRLTDDTASDGTVARLRRLTETASR